MLTDLPSYAADDLYDMSSAVALGAGAYGTVLRASRRACGGQVALKVMASEKMDDEDLDKVLEEVRALEHLRPGHEHVVGFVEAFRYESTAYIAMDLVDGGELFDRIVDLQRFDEDVARACIRSVLSGLKYIHDRGVIHRDIKPENILLVGSKEITTAESMTQLKIVDMGEAHIFAAGETGTRGIRGSPMYIAPECLDEDHDYGLPVDMWSVGIVTFCLLCGAPPFVGADNDAVLEAVKGGDWGFENNDIWGAISPVAKRFIEQLMERDASKRLTVEMALRSRWLTAEDVGDEEAGDLDTALSSCGGGGGSGGGGSSLRVPSVTSSSKNLPALKGTQRRLQQFNAQRHFVAATQACLVASHLRALLVDRRSEGAAAAVVTGAAGGVGGGGGGAVLDAVQARRVQRVFSIYDHNGDGLIDRAELGDMLRRLDPFSGHGAAGKLKDSDLDHLMNRIDSDESGGVSFVEFARLVEDTGILDNDDGEDEGERGGGGGAGEGGDAEREDEEAEETRLRSLSRSELQQLCKAAGIRGNQKTVVLVDGLLEVWRSSGGGGKEGNESKEGNEGGGQLRGMFTAMAKRSGSPEHIPFMALKQLLSIAFPRTSTASPEELDALVARADTDGDGRISWDEFQALYDDASERPTFHLSCEHIIQIWALLASETASSSGDGKGKSVPPQQTEEEEPQEQRWPGPATLDNVVTLDAVQAAVASASQTLNTPPPRPAHIRKVFLVLQDAAPSNVVTLTGLLLACFPFVPREQRGTEVMVELAFRAADCNGDGNLALDELARLVGALVPAQFNAAGLAAGQGVLSRESILREIAHLFVVCELKTRGTSADKSSQSLSSSSATSSHTHCVGDHGTFGGTEDFKISLPMFLRESRRSPLLRRMWNGSAHAADAVVGFRGGVGGKEMTASSDEKMGGLSWGGYLKVATKKKGARCSNSVDRLTDLGQAKKRGRPGVGNSAPSMAKKPKS